jgi:urease accessory protein
MNRFEGLRSRCSVTVLRRSSLLIAAILILLATATPAFAHHAMDGKMPVSFFEGLMTGLAHPVIELAHFAFIVAIGLLAVGKKQGFLIPVSFVLATMLGTGLHLAGLTLPGQELLVSGSILVFGLFLVIKNSPNPATVTSLSAIAGVFHGYAYGESIVGAEMTALVAYLIGFTAVQLAIALAACWIGKATLGKATVSGQTSVDQSASGTFKSAGLVICGIGLAFFASQVVSILFPLARA